MNITVFSALLIISLTTYADELSNTAIKDQQSMQQACFEKSNKECDKKCSSSTNENIHCRGICKLVTTNQCRYAGE